MICYAVVHSIQLHLTGSRKIRHSEREEKKQTDKKNREKMQTHECEIVFYLSIHNSSYKRFDIQFTVSFIYFWWVKVKKSTEFVCPKSFSFDGTWWTLLELEPTRCFPMRFLFFSFLSLVVEWKLISSFAYQLAWIQRILLLFRRIFFFLLI